MHNAEHLVFLVVGYLFWRQIFGNDPNATASTPPCSSSTSSWPSPSTPSPGSPWPGQPRVFPAYLATHRTWGPSYVVDLHIGGVIMWVGRATPSCCGR